MKIIALTWNTHNTSDLPRINYEADIIIVSLQECYSLTSRRKLIKAMVDSEKHYYLETCSMLGLKTIVISKEKLDISFYRVGQGPFGFLNKGFIGTVINSNISHINAHLAPHDFNAKKRALQLDEIIGFVPLHVDTVLLTGDLNFRSVMESSSFFRKYPMFQEGTISFLPTYKYKGKEPDQRRTPAYCDRVIYSSLKHVEIHVYDSLHTVLASDHKPVICVAEIVEDKKSEKEVAVVSAKETKAIVQDRFKLKNTKRLVLERVRTRAFIFLLENWALVAFLVTCLIIVEVKSKVRILAE